MKNTTNKKIYQTTININNNTIISLRNVVKIYKMNTPEEVKALRGINLDIRRGDFVDIIGPSGSGKSTLINILGCMDKPTSGELIIDKYWIRTARDMHNIRRYRIGFVFQDMYLLPELSVYENILVPLIPYTITNEHKKRAVELLRIMGLKDKLKSKPSELSGGQKQRVAICRALINDPDIILADEPTGNLDSKTGTEILELLKSINKMGKTIIIVTHDPKVNKYTNVTVEIKDGLINNIKI